MTHFRALLIVLLVLSPSMARAVPMLATPQSSKVSATPVEEAYKEAIGKLAANDLAGAEKAFRHVLTLRPDHASALLGLSEIAFKKKQIETAAKLIRQAVQAEPGNAHAHASLGRMLAMQKKYAEAESSLKKAAELDARLVRPRMDLADLYATVLRKPKDAIALYQSVLAIAPDHAGAHFAQGIVHMRLGEMEPARTALENSARLEPGNPLPLVELAHLHIATRQPDKALPRLEQALKIQPKLADALELRGDARQMRGEAEPALADFAAAVRAQPNRISALLKLGSLQQQLGRAEAATKSYLAVIKLDSRQAVAYNNLAWMAAENGKNLDQAERWSLKAVELAPEVADFHDTLAWVYRARGKPKDAERSLLRATGLKGAPASAFYHLGVVRRELGNNAGAGLAFKKALSLDKSHKPASQALRQLGGS